MPQTPEQTLRIGDNLHGFTIKAINEIQEMFLRAYELEHERTGAKVVHLHCEDEECLFSINFPTPPEDDTGLPHIMEHSVLSGSRKFPVRDPFFEMYKMSMATFINAMTGADCTYYPVCSNVSNDLFNLANVYFDAVFHPLLTPATFKREGHHLVPAEPADPTRGLAVNGIVFNEMKAAFSKPEARLGRIAFRQLLPETCYGKESGGDPEAIPDLTYDQFMAFHKHWYHPSNAHFVFYGSLPTEAYTEFLCERLAPFERQDVRPVFGKQTKWSQPRQIIESYDVGNEDPEGKTFIEMNWWIPLDLSPEAIVLMEILGLVLVGDDAAPLKKAIIDSGLGRDLLPSGTGQVGRDVTFTVGIRGSEQDRIDAFRDLVLRELSRLVETGIEPDLVDSAFRRYSYALREIKPMQPLHAAHHVLASWIQGGDPLLLLRLQNVLDTCRERCSGDPSVLVDILRDQLLENTHRLDVCMVPDPEWQKKTEQAFAERMAEIRAGFTDDQMTVLAEEARKLQEEAGTPNSPEALATLPQLKRNDLPPGPTHIPTTVEKLSTGTDFLRHDVFSNGVNYLELYIDLAGLPAELWMYVPRLVDTIKKLGAGAQDFVAMARRTSAATGSFSCTTSYAGHVVDARQTRKGIVIILKALDEQMSEALGVLHDRVFTPNPGDRARFRDVVIQNYSRMQTSLINGGPTTAAGQIKKGLTEVGYLQELTHGLSQYLQIGQLANDFEDGFDSVLSNIQRLAGFVLNRNRFTVSFTGSDGAAEQVKKAIAAWLEGLPADPVCEVPTGFQPAAGPVRLGFAGPMQTAHCVQVLPALHNSHPDSPLLTLAMAMLRVDYMVSELRFKGNAYGASCSYDGRTITLSTYADPHVKRTLDVFLALKDYVATVPWSDVELTRGVLSTARSFVRPIRPEQATADALNAHLTGDTTQVREQRYRSILAATPEKLRTVLLNVLEEGYPKAPVAVLASREKLEQANTELGQQKLQISELLAI